MNILTALGILNASLATATQVSDMIQKAQAEGRTEFTADEWQVILDAEAAAHVNLYNAIATASNG